MGGGVSVTVAGVDAEGIAAGLLEFGDDTSGGVLDYLLNDPGLDSTNLARRLLGLAPAASVTPLIRLESSPTLGRASGSQATAAES